jgi:hypothetical protein
MKTNIEYLLISAPTEAGKHFLKRVQSSNLPFIALTNNINEQLEFEELGIKQIIHIEMDDPSPTIIPEYPIGRHERITSLLLG